ncbi:hypothetical protein F4V57_14235 [Acinetobacter qingfengensis]|uniref:Uncharacterized protein n=1 Tax=Acinetobacter qingfengensis TaxID=1262585 RepID=A0A1E7QYV0_9GAMM|nr:hypothetical protein [Acinetobacter qingfengensis]KAA8731008.1 hypothetical protein F4V57_14235 [Acinetobacter qingfengensis]OEY92213.1 hypothetical protein BJI46_05530 [Acinetobacter qingfengensis]
MSDYKYITMACRIAIDEDEEVDFIVNGESLVIVAIESCGKDGIEIAHDKLMNHFPNHKVITTHMPLFGYFDTALEIMDLEAEIAKCGQTFHHEDKPHRLDDAFNWEELHNPVVQKGSC